MYTLHSKTSGFGALKILLGVIELYMICVFVFFACREKLLDPTIESHVRAVVAITTLLKNAPELGSGQIGKDGVLQMMLSMAQSDDKVQQIVAAEALIAASAKKKDTNLIVSQVCCPPSID